MDLQLNFEDGSSTLARGFSFDTSVSSSVIMSVSGAPASVLGTFLNDDNVCAVLSTNHSKRECHIDLLLLLLLLLLLIIIIIITYYYLLFIYDTITK